MGNFAVLNFDNLSFKFFFSLLTVVEIACMVFRKSMGVTVHETALAFDSEQAYFFIAVEASFAILLFALRRF